MDNFNMGRIGIFAGNIYLLIEKSKLWKFPLSMFDFININFRCLSQFIGVYLFK